MACQSQMQNYRMELEVAHSNLCGTFNTLQSELSSLQSKVPVKQPAPLTDSPSKNEAGK
jgi:hypothetical protein